MAFTIGIHALRLLVSIGAGDEERGTPQVVRFDLEIALDHPPDAVSTDRLDQTIDYAGVCDTVRHVATHQPYRLLERLVGAVRDEVGRLLPPDARVRVTATKEKPPIPGVDGGTSVTLSNDPPAR